MANALLLFASLLPTPNTSQNRLTLVGVPSESLDGTLSAEERDARIKRFERGETLVLTSCDVISEGFDLPAIEAAILLKAYPKPKPLFAASRTRIAYV